MEDILPKKWGAWLRAAVYAPAIAVASSLLLVLIVSHLSPRLGYEKGPHTIWLGMIASFVIAPGVFVAVLLLQGGSRGTSSIRGLVLRSGLMGAAAVLLNLSILPLIALAIIVSVSGFWRLLLSLAFVSMLGPAIMIGGAWLRRWLAQSLPGRK